LKILFCAYDRPGHIASGPNTWIQRLVPDLRNTYGLDVTTLFIYNGEEDKCPTLSHFRAKQLPLVTINKDDFPYVADQAKEILKIIKSNKITVLIANLVIPAYYAARFLKPFNIPVIGVLHSNDTFYKGVIDKFITGTEQDRLTKVVSVSRYIDNLIIGSNGSSDSIVISCGTPMSSVNVKQRTLKDFKIIFAGRLVIEAKQILKVTQAFCNASKTNENYEFNIFGDGDQDQNVQTLINKNSSEQQVKLHAALPPEKIINKIAEHHVFTLLSDYEGMPLSLMEAMACGVVPVCYINEGGIDEIVEHGVNGFIVKNREEDYQDKLKSLVDDQLLWEQMSENAIQTIKTRYSSDITHKQWFELLNGYKNNTIKKVRIPFNMKLDGELLYYGDNRKPTLKVLLKNDLNRRFQKIRLYLRPRARLKSLFDSIKN
jgi:glycosyltransferase involved in cell wall biosynthesis